jgi:serine/threonine-protein kinase
VTSPSSKPPTSSGKSSTQSLPPLSAGRQLGDKFEIVGVLGEGGMGIVYDARRIGVGGSVDQDDPGIALKVIHQHLAGDAQIRGRFTREAAILRRLEGVHLCPILDFGEVKDPRGAASLLFIALPRIEGPALDALLKAEKVLPARRAIAIVLDVCEALSEAHAQGIIHRDLKPGNVLLRAKDREEAVVVDFGMAKIITGGGTGTTALTQHNMVFGTPEYMAPEQARGDELDARCDVYAAGVILYELLTGTVPFRGATPLSVLTAHLTEPPQPPRERAPDRDISPALEAVVMNAIAKDPRDRYATAGALAAALRAAVAAPVDVAAVTPPAAHAAEVARVDSHAPTVPAPEPVPSSRRGADSRMWLVVTVLAAVAGIALGFWLSMRGR